MGVSPKKCLPTPVCRGNPAGFFSFQSFGQHGKLWQLVQGQTLFVSGAVRHLHLAAEHLGVAARHPPGLEHPQRDLLPHAGDAAWTPLDPKPKPVRFGRAAVLWRKCWTARNAGKCAEGRRGGFFGGAKLDPYPAEGYGAGNPTIVFFQGGFRSYQEFCKDMVAAKVFGHMYENVQEGVHHFQEPMLKQHKREIKRCWKGLATEQVAVYPVAKIQRPR